MNTISLKTLPWGTLEKQFDSTDETNKTAAIDSAAFMVLPQHAFGGAVLQSTDPFRRIPKNQGESLPEIYSLAERSSGWSGEEIKGNEFIMDEEQDFTLDMKAEDFMDIVQGVLKKYDYVFFHPDDLQIVAKKEIPETYILFNAVCTGEEQIDVNMIRSMGNESEFATIVASITEEIREIIDADGN